MNLEALNAREQAIKEITLSAGFLALQHFRERTPGNFTLKGQQDFLTEADALVEKHIIEAIARAFPEDGVLGEESGGAACDALWVIDPIDGTANFARGIEHFCISIAFVFQGTTQLGAIYNPATNEFYFARKNQGATKNDRSLSVSNIEHLSNATFELGWSTRVPEAVFLKVTQAILASGANIRRGASGALALAWVAEGRTDGYAELHMNAWDCLAGLLLVSEAGGQIGTFPESIQEIERGGAIIAVTAKLATSFSQSTQIALAAMPKQPNTATV